MFRKKPRLDELEPAVAKTVLRELCRAWMVASPRSTFRCRAEAFSDTRN